MAEPNPAERNLASRLAAAEQEFGDLEARLADPELANDPAQLRVVATRYRGVAADRRRPRPPAPAARRSRGGRGTARRRRSRRPAAARGRARRGQRRPRRDRRGAPRTPGVARSARRAGGDHRDPRRRGRRGGQPVRPRSLRHVRRLRRQPGWKVETLSHDASDLGGVNQVTFVVRGGDAWQRLKFEGGPHRVQRVPVTESQGRVHTSSATVAVLAEADEVDVHDRRPRPLDRCLPVVRSRRPARQHDRFGGAHHARAERPGRHDAGRAQPAPEPGAGDAGAASPAVRARRARARAPSCRPSGGRRSAAVDAARRSAPTTTRRTGSPTTASGSRSTGLSDVLAGDLDLVVEALLLDERSRSSPSSMAERVARSASCRAEIQRGQTAERRRSSGTLVVRGGDIGARRRASSIAALDEPATERMVAHLDAMLARYRDR